MKHFCQVRLTTDKQQHLLPSDYQQRDPPKCSAGEPIDCIKLDPDNLLSQSDKVAFQNLLLQHSNVFDPGFKSYNGAVGPFEANVKWWS